MKHVQLLENRRNTHNSSQLQVAQLSNVSVKTVALLHFLHLNWTEIKQKYQI
jgi:hypothetical protein